MKTLSDKEADELLTKLGEQLAADTQTSDPAELQRRVHELHRPLEPEVLDRISQRLLEQPAKRHAPSARAQRLDTVAPAPARSVSGARRHIVWLMPLALAAVLLLTLWRRTPHDEPLARYAIEVHGAASLQRGAEASAERGQLRISPARTLELVARPSVPEPAQVTAALFLARAGKLEPLESEWTRSSSGAVRIEARLPTFAAGTRLRVVLALPGVDAAEVARANAEAGPGWQRFEFELSPADG